MMLKTLTLRNVPENVVAALRRRSARHGRSMQAELLAIVEASVIDGESLEEQIKDFRRKLERPLTIDEIHEAIDEGRP